MGDEPNVSPEQQDLRRQAARPIAVAIVATVGVELAAALGYLWDSRFYWAAWAAGIVVIATVLRIISIMRALRRSGAPFHNLRWWWPRGR
jgi:hypothetical protein